MIDQTQNDILSLQKKYHLSTHDGIDDNVQKNSSFARQNISIYNDGVMSFFSGEPSSLK
jgi:hypothetical protein